jgi:hypothetical protein
MTELTCSYTWHFASRKRKGGLHHDSPETKQAASMTFDALIVGSKGLFPRI